MKDFLLILSLLFYCLLGFSQEEKAIGIFESDSTWLKEIIPFPMGFAPEIKFDGYEDLRFAKSWRDKDHPDFWSYTFVWHVNGIHKLTQTELEQQLTFYYDGLMTAVNKKKDYTIPNTKVDLIVSNHSADYDYRGEIFVYDSFNLEEMITLNVRIKSQWCETNQETIMVFRLSPQAFNQPIWNRFKEITLNEDLCD